MEGELQDWELLNNSDSDSRVISPKLKNLEETAGDADDLIRSDYFSLDNQGRHMESVTVGTDGNMSEESAVESDDSSWTDRRSQTRLERKNFGEFLSGSGCDRHDESRVGNFDANQERGFYESEKGPAPSEETGGLEYNTCKNGIADAKEESDFTENVKNELGLEDFGEIQVEDRECSKLWSDSRDSCLVSLVVGDVENDCEIGFSEQAKMVAGSDDLSGNRSEMESDEEGKEGAGIQEMEPCAKAEAEEENRGAEWWKVPFQVLKCCVFKVSPVWSISLAAAVMGFVILGHRLYKMKRRTRSLQLKVTVDDKKAFQFISRAARLNEALSAVRRVPIVRPSLQAAVANPCRVMSVR